MYRCSKSFCTNHCSYKKRLNTSSDEALQESAEEEESERYTFVLTSPSNSVSNAVYLCKKCYQKSLSQSVGATRDKTDLFARKRSAHHNSTEQQQDAIIRKLEKVSIHNSTPFHLQFILNTSLPESKLECS